VHGRLLSCRVLEAVEKIALTSGGRRLTFSLTALMQVALKKDALLVELYDSRTVATQLGIPYRTLMYWVETGLIRPHTYSGRRRTPVKFSDKDVKEIGRLVQLRRYLRGQSLRDVLNTLREMGHNPLSQGDFLVLENRKGQRNVIKIMYNNEAIELLHAQPERQLRLIPLTGDEVQEAISAGRQEVLFSTRESEASRPALPRPDEREHGG
jgi:DNA-binding transcriptional MerR regulator